MTLHGLGKTPNELLWTQVGLGTTWVEAGLTLVRPGFDLI